ncbi:Aldo/keto reductase [Phellopilus nigrolimitatus]|nr:Aldo/keto reductase [Phellopilus nigrolimitatus]
MVMPLGSPQPTFVLPPSENIAETVDEIPEEGMSLSKLGSCDLPALIFGGGAFSNQYNDDSHLESLIPLRTVRTALRYGITAFDTSAYYGPSEIVLGTVLKGLEPEFPRSSYQLMTKCGRYGMDKDAFDYSPKTIRRSIERSLTRLNTDYLDVVYLHDVEFVGEEIMPKKLGVHSAALGAEAELYGLAEGQEAKIWGDGDQRVLDAYRELQKLQSEGVVRKVGITGYPLPTLLRLALLILHTPPFKPVDILLSYSHSNLQNDVFADFAPVLRARARVGQLVSASPLNMGLLTPTPPAWHPAPAELRAAVAKAVDACAAWPGGLPNVALGYAMRKDGLFRGREQEAQMCIEDIPVVVGMSVPAEVHEDVRIWREVHHRQELAERQEAEQKVISIFKDSGFLGWSWASNNA